jgi:hypothetical protein
LTVGGARFQNAVMNSIVVSLGRQSLLVLVAALLLVGLQGCSISKSLSDSSDSSSDSSASSSASSSPASKESLYRDDVRDYTAAYVKSGGQITDFNVKVSQLAQQRGITNWEENMATYEGIGQGLAKADVTGVAYDTYVANLSRGDPNKAAAIRKGYESYKK